MGYWRTTFEMVRGKPEERIAKSVGRIINLARTQAITLADETFPVIEKALIEEAENTVADEYTLAAVQATMDDLQKLVDGLVIINQLRGERTTTANIAVMKMKEVVGDSVEIVNELANTGTVALNLRVWMTADPEFIWRVLSLAIESARNEAVGKLDEETRMAWILALQKADQQPFSDR